MEEQVTYYGLLLSGDTRERPGGLARRRVLPDGQIVEETFQKDLRWHRDNVVWEWERGGTTERLIEITQAEAERVMERFRETFGR
ncbi:hypothetical protein [Streptosporangium sp. NPDC002607]